MIVIQRHHSISQFSKPRPELVIANKSVGKGLNHHCPIFKSILNTWLLRSYYQLVMRVVYHNGVLNQELLTTSKIKETKTAWKQLWGKKEQFCKIQIY